MNNNPFDKKAIEPSYTSPIFETLNFHLGHENSINVGLASEASSVKYLFHQVEMPSQY